MSSDMTTVKVSKHVRSRLNERAGRRHLTADAYIAGLLEADEWAERMAETAEGMRSMSNDERDDYLAESASWDTVHLDPK